MRTTELLIVFLALTGYYNSQCQNNGSFVETNGLKLYYEVHGEGEALLLLHGNTMTHDMWTPWLADLSKSYKVITVDMRGHGLSSNPSKKFSHKEGAIDFYGLLDQLKVDQFKAMGFSSGAMILTHMATMDNRRIQSLVLIGSTTYFPISNKERSKDLTYESISINNPGWMEYMKSVQPGGEDQIRSLLKNYIHTDDSYRDMNFTAPLLSTINCPTLIVHGDRDPFFSIDIPLSSYRAIPNSFLWIIPNFYHSTPEKGTALGTIFIDTVSRFLADEWK